MGEFSSHVRYLEGGLLGEATIEPPSSMTVFKTEDMVETSAPAGTSPKRGTLLLTLFCSRPQQTSETKYRYSSSRSGGWN